MGLAGLFLLYAQTIHASSFAGVYSVSDDKGRSIVLTLHEEPDGEVNGTIVRDGSTFIVEAEKNGNSLEGLLMSENFDEGSESYIKAKMQGNKLLFTIMKVGSDGMPDRKQSQTLALSRTGNLSATPIPSTPSTNQPTGSFQGAGTGAILNQQNAPPQQGVLSKGVGGVFTQSAAIAYIEALEFCLAQVGNPTKFDPASRQQIIQNLSKNFPLLPAQVQQSLANARQIWTQYQQTWNSIGMEEKKAFAYDVLSMGYGEAVALPTYSPSLSPSG
jgi:hypothetical protein